MTNPRTLAALLHDLVAVVFAWMLAFALRFNFDVPGEFLAVAWQSLWWVLPLFGALFFAFGLYRGLWRFASLSDLQHLALAVGTGALLTTAVVVFLEPAIVPRSVLVLHPILLASVMGGSRFAYRSWKEHRLYGPDKMCGQPVLVLGAGEAADSLLRELNRSGLWYAVALVDDNPSKIGRRLRRLPVFGPFSRIGEVAEKYGARPLTMTRFLPFGHENRRLESQFAQSTPASSARLAGRATAGRALSSRNQAARRRLPVGGYRSSRLSRRP